MFETYFRAKKNEYKAAQILAQPAPPELHVLAIIVFASLGTTLQNIAKYNITCVMWSSVTRVASSLTLIWCLALGAQVDSKEQTRADVKSQN